MKLIKNSKTPKLPVVTVSQNFHFAKNMHAGNLEHQPLPDTLGYRHLTKVGEHRDSDIVVKPYAIGWKGYGASGPTCCTKMRVHRPKTSDPKKTEIQHGDRKQRPSTSAGDLGGQYKKPLSLMDLAICWDFQSDNPQKEPKPPKHINGSNGSLAPAVFTMVRTPKEEVQDNIATSHSQSIFNQNRDVQNVGRHTVPYFEKDMSKERRNDACDVQYCPQHTGKNEGANTSNHSSRKNSSRSSKNLCDGINGCGTPVESKYETRHGNCVKDKQINSRRHDSLESYSKTLLAQGQLHQSTPDQSETSRSPKNSGTSNNNNKHKNCFSCSGKKLPSEKKEKEDYKFAFKAGNPNSVQSVSSNDSKGVKIPKMRHPYTKKSYTIPTLAPPFSIWRDANATGYPEHWRLASVYQHAYKPPEQRRKPLISSVYQ
ncbi:uncharacterized protein LOC126968068 [Leptidea sinapis]|uniref:uncharacterized protein LOC126968068 n=1 Tax=Leptidea sinapis TaxID=189913 RepID=UPI00212F05D6|nr:uncharacterized protein LOC126968068 [Leptidea sinapis]